VSGTPPLAAFTQAALSRPLLTSIWTADPSAHVFEGRVYVYCSHDIDAGIPDNDLGDQYAMEDYHVLAMDAPDGMATDCGVALHVRDVPWAAKQMWAPDAAFHDGRYYLFFPARDPAGFFRLGVATSDQPAGPFVAEPLPIAGSYSIDPAVYADRDGAFYLYFGGLWGGQLQQYRDNRHDPSHAEPAPHEPALGPRMAQLTPDLKQFAHPPREILILDESGQRLRAGDHARRYFEAPWLHRYRDRYYLSWSTGNTHVLCWATSDSPYGPFTYGGRILEPVVGWTTHHSIVEHGGRWWLFHQDALASGGRSHLRSVKVAELVHEADGRIRTIEPYGALPAPW
jgi:hypothetical protein